jgi:hypothetical protein
MCRVCSEQPMQHAGTAARQTQNNKGFVDFLARNIRIELAIPFHLQAGAQTLQNIGLQSNFPDQVELCLVLA